MRGGADWLRFGPIIGRHRGRTGYGPDVGETWPVPWETRKRGRVPETRPSHCRRGGAARRTARQRQTPPGPKRVVSGPKGGEIGAVPFQPDSGPRIQDFQGGGGCRFRISVQDFGLRAPSLKRGLRSHRATKGPRHGGGKRGVPEASGYFSPAPAGRYRRRVLRLRYGRLGSRPQQPSWA